MTRPVVLRWQLSLAGSQEFSSYKERKTKKVLDDNLNFFENFVQDALLIIKSNKIFIVMILILYYLKMQSTKVKSGKSKDDFPNNLFTKRNIGLRITG